MPLPCAPECAEPLIELAVRTRPDVLAAEQAIVAARARVCLAEVGWVRLLGLLDATSGTESHVPGPAFRITVPILNQNEGNIARAKAELERAERNKRTVQNQVVLDVRQAHLRYTQARHELDYLLGQVRPALRAAIDRAERAYRGGGTSYLIVLETSRQLIDTYDREATLRADLRRAWADLERSVGQHLPCDWPAGGDAKLPEAKPPAELPPPTPAKPGATP
jgi:cobalt-zinc-cadmium efflux system outer membrane protein